jgi:hypothetical protein
MTVTNHNVVITLADRSRYDCMEEIDEAQRWLRRQVPRFTLECSQEGNTLTGPPEILGTFGDILSELDKTSGPLSSRRDIHLTLQ